MKRPFSVKVSTILRTGESRREVRRGPIPDLFVTGSEVPAGGEVEIDVVLSAVDGSVKASGLVRTPWQGDCRRCLKPLAGMVEGAVDELFEPRHEEGETYPLDHDEVDLEPLARDTVMLELPRAPLCYEDCKGLCSQCGADRNEGPCSCAPPLDPRWAVLDELGDAE